MKCNMILSAEIDKLPVSEVFDSLNDSLKKQEITVLKAPPGSGKSTALPALFVNNDLCAGKKILMLEPRRIACMMVAQRIAYLLGDSVGNLVGWRMRGDKKISGNTRLEIVTEGTFTRIIQNDMELKEYGLIIFDEFHERNIHSDLGLALALDVRRNLRDDLGILVMSATLDIESLQKFLPESRCFECCGRMYDLTVEYAAERIPFENIVKTAFNTVVRILQNTESGNILVFLPGAGEIEKLSGLLKNIAGENCIIAPLYGALSRDAQQKALKKTLPGERKTVIATNIAESSVTIDDIQFVIDSGWEKRIAFDPRCGMDRLELQRIAASSAIQRAGRAGRTGKGTVYRLYTVFEFESMMEYPLPEVACVDLSNFCLELALWGCEAADLQFLTPPPAGNLEQGVTLLKELDLLDDDGNITAYGRNAAVFSGSCRLGRMFHAAKMLNLEILACEIAAMLEERSLPAVDLEHALEILRRNPTFSFRRNLDLLMHERRLTYRMQDCSYIGNLLLAGFPDRAGRKRRNSRNEYLLANGRGAVVPDDVESLNNEYIIAPVADMGSKTAVIYGAAVLDEKLLPENKMHFAFESCFDSRSGVFIIEKVKYFLKMAIERKMCTDFNENAFKEAVLAECRKRSIEAVFGCDDRDMNFLNRCNFAHGIEPDKYPDVSCEKLLADGKFTDYIDCSGHSLAALKKQSFMEIIKNFIGYEVLINLDRDYPERYVTPGNSSYRLRYESGCVVLSVPIAEMYGTSEHPVLGRKRIPLKIELLSPAMRPVQITVDLPEFWRTNWTYVRKEMKQRYIKHFWPEDPANAVPGKSIRRQHE